jgi:predicted O-methyltransferase YrrM
MKSLSAIVAKYGAYKPEFYHPIYERAFGAWRDKPIKLLELGVFEGGSLLAWRDYFPNGEITGVDINPCHVARDRIRIYQANTNNFDDMGAVCRERGPFDIIVDDASHDPEDWYGSYQMLWTALKPGGIYAIEDLCTARVLHWPEEKEIAMRENLHKLMLPMIEQQQADIYSITIHQHIVLVHKA